MLTMREFDTWLEENRDKWDEKGEAEMCIELAEMTVKAVMMAEQDFLLGFILTEHLEVIATSIATGMKYGYAMKEKELENG